MKPWRAVLATSGEASCREVGRKLQLYLDGELDPADIPRVRTHLERCRRCDLEAAVYREIKWALLSTVPAPDPAAVSRLQGFADQLVTGGPPSGGHSA